MIGLSIGVTHCATKSGLSNQSSADVLRPDTVTFCHDMSQTVPRPDAPLTTSEAVAGAATAVILITNVFVELFPSGSVAVMVTVVPVDVCGVAGVHSICLVVVL